MKVRELIEELQKFDGEIPVYDWDNDLITYVILRPKEVKNFDECQRMEFDVEFPERIEIG